MARHSLWRDLEVPIPKSGIQALMWSLVSMVWVFSTSLLSTYLPRISWVGQPRWEVGAYDHLSFLDRISQMFVKWDAIRYLAIARQGYSTELWEHAFFPGWPWLLKYFFQIFSIGSKWEGVSVFLMNGLFLAGAIHIWSLIWRRCTPGREVRRTLFLLVFYPCSIFFAAAYPETLVIFLSGVCAWATLESRHRGHLLWALPLLVSAKHIGLSLGIVFPLWLLLKEGFRSWWVWIVYGVGVGLILLFYAREVGDPWVWIKAQESWGRHWGAPWQVLLDLKGKGVELVFYVVVLFGAPLWWWKQAGGLAALWRARKVEGLMFFLVCSVYLPVWFGSSTASLYRVILLGTPALLWPVVLFSKLSPRAWRVFALCTLMLNLHATYRFVVGLNLP